MNSKVLVIAVLVAVVAYDASASAPPPSPPPNDPMMTGLTSSCYNMSTDTTYNCTYFSCSGCDAFASTSCSNAQTTSYTPFSLMECYRETLADVGNGTWPANATTCSTSQCTASMLATIFCTEFGNTCNFTGPNSNAALARYANMSQCMSSFGTASGSAPGAVKGTQFCQDKHLWFARVTPNLANNAASGPSYHCPHAGATVLCNSVKQGQIAFSINAPSAAVQQQIVMGINNGSYSTALFNSIVNLQAANPADGIVTGNPIVDEGVRVPSDITWAATATNATTVEVTMSFWYYSIPLTNLYGTQSATFSYLSRTVAAVFPGSTYTYLSNIADLSMTPALGLSPSWVPTMPTAPTQPTAGQPSQPSPPAKTSSAARSAFALIAVLVAILSCIIAM